MRPVLHSDVTASARALLCIPEQARADFCGRLLRDASWADKFTKRLGKPHPLWGNGTLMAAARAHALAPEPTFDDTNYCNAMATVLAQLVARNDTSTCKLR